jgi:superfamily II helicase
MIQNIIALVIVGLVVVKVIYSVYKSVTVKDKTVCGGCASCELKNELKKKGKLTSQLHATNEKLEVSVNNLRYVTRKS